MATVTKELSGKISKGEKRWHYSTMYFGSEFCQDFTECFDWADGIYDIDDEVVPDEITPSWGGGVVNDGAERMAVILLAAAHSGWGDIDYLIGEDFPGAVVYRVNNHYKQYAKEVVAHLPDNWSMTRAQILEWIDKRERKKKK